jgi:hypothetical protein
LSGGPVVLRSTVSYKRRYISADRATARTKDTISQAIANALETIKPAECKNYFASAGYKQI